MLCNSTSSFAVTAAGCQIPANVSGERSVVEPEVIHYAIDAFEHEPCLPKAWPAAVRVDALGRDVDDPFSIQPVVLLAGTVSLQIPKQDPKHA